MTVIWPKNSNWPIHCSYAPKTQDESHLPLAGSGQFTWMLFCAPRGERDSRYEHRLCTFRARAYYIACRGRALSCLSFHRQLQLHNFTSLRAGWNFCEPFYFFFITRRCLDRSGAETFETLLVVLCCSCSSASVRSARARDAMESTISILYMSINWTDVKSRHYSRKFAAAPCQDPDNLFLHSLAKHPVSFI